MGDSKAKVGLSFMYDCPAGLKDVSFDLIYKLLIKYVEVSKIFLESGTGRQPTGRKAT